MQRVTRSQTKSETQQDNEQNSKIPLNQAQKKDKNQSSGSESEGENMKRSPANLQMLRIIKELKQSVVGSVFLTETSPSESKLVPESFVLPTSLETIEYKLRHSRFPTSFHFALEMRKLWCFCATQGNMSEIYTMAHELAVKFEKLIRGHENYVLTDSYTQESKLYYKQKQLECNLANQLTMIAQSDNKPKVHRARQLNNAQIKELKDGIAQLLDSEHVQLCKIMEHEPYFQQSGGEINLDFISPETKREMLRFVRQTKKKQAILERRKWRKQKKEQDAMIKRAHKQKLQIEKRNNVPPPTDTLVYKKKELTDTEDDVVLPSSSESEEIAEPEVTNNDPFAVWESLNKPLDIQVQQTYQISNIQNGQPQRNSFNVSRNNQARKTISYEKQS